MGALDVTTSRAAFGVARLFRSLVSSGLEAPGRRRNLHLRHHPLHEPELRREPRQLRQRADQLPLALRSRAALGALREVDVPGRGEETLSPKLDFVGGQVLYEGVAHCSVLRAARKPGFAPAGPPGNPAIR